MTAPARFFDGLTATDHPATVSLRGATLVIAHGENVLASWPVAEIERCDDTGSAGQATLRRRASPARLRVADPAVLAELAAAGVKLRHRPAWSARQYLGLGIAFAAAFGVLALLVQVLPDLATPLVPAELERSWAESSRAVLAAAMPPCDRTEGLDVLRRLVGRLSDAADLPVTPDVQVLDTGLVNALTFPDGNIVVLRGLLLQARDGDELAGVLAHELGHVKRRDPTREMVRRTALNLTARSLGWGAGLAGDLTALSYGRRAEAAADAFALDTLARAGLRQDGLGRFLGRLAGDGAEPPAFLSDHPGARERAARLRRPATGSPALTPAEWRAVRAACG